MKWVARYKMQISRLSMQGCARPTHILTHAWKSSSAAVCVETGPQFQALALFNTEGLGSERGGEAESPEEGGMRDEDEGIARG
jgi:hypothetical protein